MKGEGFREKYCMIQVYSDKLRPSFYSKKNDKSVIVININYVLLHDLILYLDKSYHEGSICIILFEAMRTPSLNVHK